MARKRPPNSESDKPVLTLRVTPETIQALDELAGEVDGASRASIAGEILAEALEDKGLDVEAVSAKERAAHKAASVVRARLMRAVRKELDALEAESA